MLCNSSVQLHEAHLNSWPPVPNPQLTAQHNISISKRKQTPKLHSFLVILQCHLQIRSLLLYLRMNQYLTMKYK